MRRSLVLSALLFSLNASVLQAQTARVLTDLSALPSPAAAYVLSEFMPFDGALYFVASAKREADDRDATRLGLWRYDGTGPAQRVAEAEDVRASYVFAETEGALLFWSEADLWQWDGTTLEQVISGRRDLRMCSQSMAVYRGVAYFCASQPRESSFGDEELWAWDGEQARLVADLRPGEMSSQPFDFTIWNDRLYFSAYTEDTGHALWAFDGADVTVAAQIGPALSSGRPADLTVSGGALYFSAADAAHGRELWRFDGTDATLIADVYVGPESSNPTSLVDVNGRLHFSADDVQAARLWRLTETGVEVAADVWPWHGYDDWRHPAAIGEVLYGVLRDGVHGSELWKLEGGTPALLADLAPGEVGSDPRNLTPLGDALVFLDDDRRPWTLAMASCARSSSKDVARSGRQAERTDQRRGPALLRSPHAAQRVRVVDSQGRTSAAVLGSVP